MRGNRKRKKPTEYQKMLTRERVRKFRKSKCNLTFSAWDIPPDSEFYGLWKTWAEMRREVDRAFKNFWRKRQNAQFN